MLEKIVDDLYEFKDQLTKEESDLVTKLKYSTSASMEDIEKLRAILTKYKE